VAVRSYGIVPADLDSTVYFDILFWGGGHVLQFTYMILMLAGWLWLADACGVKNHCPRVCHHFWAASRCMFRLSI
jgi:hypothetical protein